MAVPGQLRVTFGACVRRQAQSKNEIESASDEVWRDVGGRCVLHCARDADRGASGARESGRGGGFRDERHDQPAGRGGESRGKRRSRSRFGADCGASVAAPRCAVRAGFIVASPDGVLTTLGRGGSDYSATILGAALGVDEVIIWTDVDGVLTADPRLVPDARTIPEISYREAAELAYFGAKVLHPKTLRTVMPAGIPVWIRNSFEPDRAGTRISQEGRSIGGGVKALTAIRDVALISVGGPGIVGVPDVVGRTFSPTLQSGPNGLPICNWSCHTGICFVWRAQAGT